MKNPSLDNNAVSIFEGKEFQQVYKKDNYKVSIKNEDLKCYIYFSGSGIYYPNTIDEFEKAFIQQDRYEWYTYDDIQSVGKYIWVRDIAKQFYILGINEHVNTLEKLIEMLKKETEGYKTVCIGSSAGGYAAAVVGEYLKAEYILDFSGFFSLNIVDKTVWPLVLKYENDIEKNSYYNLRQCIIDNQVPIFYFYPSQLEGDRKQAEIVEDIEEVYFFRIEADIHGIPFYHFSLKKLLSMDKDELVRLYDRSQKEKLTKQKMTELIIGKKKTYLNIGLRYLKKIKGKFLCG